MDYSRYNYILAGMLCINPLEILILKKGSQSEIPAHSCLYFSLCPFADPITAEVSCRCSLLLWKITLYFTVGLIKLLLVESQYCKS